MDELIRKAGRDRRVLRIRYTDKSGNRSERNIEPYEIRDGKLWGYCRKRRGIRQFDLSKVENPRVTRHTFIPKYPVTFDDGIKKSAAYRMQVGEHLFGAYEDAPLL